MNVWQERLALLKYRGGLKAAVFWLIKMLCRLEIHYLYAIDLTRWQASQPRLSYANPEKQEFHFISLNSAEDLAKYPRELIEQISSQSGHGAAQLVRNNAGVYALIDETSVVSQVNINRSTVVHVDSPTSLDICLAPGDVFLSYLFTYLRYRGMGTAVFLIKKVCLNLQRCGYSGIVTHIRSTNAASLNTFDKCGWSRVGWILTSTTGRLLLTRCPGKNCITVSVPKRISD